MKKKHPKTFRVWAWVRPDGTASKFYPPYVTRPQAMDWHGWWKRDGYKLIRLECREIGK